jgi:phage gp46-like protein
VRNGGVGCGCAHDATLGNCVHQQEGNVTISTDGWLRGLIYNMLMTDGRKEDTPCGYTPGAQGGHWSESFTQGQIGTLVRFIPTSGSVREGLNLVVAYAKTTLERLVARGVAVSVDVTGKYLGNGVMSLDIVVAGVGSIGVARVGVTAQRTASSWIWGSANGL